MIVKDNLTTKKDGRWSAEYTCKSGWIDWEHAVSDRPDLEAIWSQLPHVQKKGQKRLALKKIKIGKYSYYEVEFEIDQNWKQRAFSRIMQLPTHCKFYVLDAGLGNEAYYKQAALGMFIFGCNLTETIQLSFLDSRHKSGFSMEDLVSDLLAFYMHVEGMSKADIVRKSGGWIDPQIAQSYSLEIFNEMQKRGLDQPKSFNKWFYAYLFNDIKAVDPLDRRGNWHHMPAEFLKIAPLHPSASFPPAPVLTDEYVKKGIAA